MYLSELLGMGYQADREWFDTLLETDTQLFLDPFLIFKETEGEWAGAHQEIVDYFQRSFELLSGHHGNPKSPQYRKVLELMSFPEPNEFCLGYLSVGKSGSGTGAGFAKRIVQAMSEAIERGLSDLHHFEELSLLVDQIGRDRISDITANILKPRFAKYTARQFESVQHEYMRDQEVNRTSFDPLRQRWTSGHYRLPHNPFSNRPVITAPWRFLRELPSLSVEDWWNYVEPTLRSDLNLSIASKLQKGDILTLARGHTDEIRLWSEASEARPAVPYPANWDPEGLLEWQRQGLRVSVDHPLASQAVVANEEQLDQFIAKVIEKFKLFVEEQGGWRLLHNDESKRPKREQSIQLAFRGVVQGYCEAHGLQVDREVELGRGPVDFVFSKGARRILLEIKKMTNSDYWNGLERQLISYLNSDECDTGWFLAVRFGDTKIQKVRTDKLTARTSRVAEATGFRLSSTWIDARPKKSASKLEPNDEGVTGTYLNDTEFKE